jgi:hypothetical protein
MSGLESVPSVGDILQVVSSDREARQLQEAFAEHVGRARKHTFADLVSRLSQGKITQRTSAKPEPRTTMSTSRMSPAFNFCV